MPSLNFPLSSVLLISTLSSVLLPNFDAIAQTTQPSQSVAPGQLLFNAPAEDFENEGRPPSRTSAGSRNACLDLLIALVPGQQEVSMDESGCSARSDAAMALTISEQPTLWFYLPEFAREGAIAELVLLNEALQPTFIQPVTLENTTGIIGVLLEQPLEVGHVYHWVFSVESNTSHSSEPLVVGGFIKRIEPDDTLTTALSSDTLDQERLVLYANHGIWHDALTLIVNLRRANQNDLTLRRQWSSFLDSVGLEAIANAPLSTCCEEEQSP
ncbi:DUF928 domain-containing protein [Leptolyngbya sp. PL-A3]|uniref:DUF928 domain-containing protein n=1 Tax=Leptolyngbya sp. PL-A3 TaxID=2933911 RepID=UPI0032967EA4